MENKQLDKITVLKNGLTVLAEHYYYLQAKASTKAAFNPQRDKLLYNAYLVKKFMQKMLKNYSTRELKELHLIVSEENNFYVNDTYYYAAKLNAPKAVQSKKKSHVSQIVLDATKRELQAREQAHKEAQEFAK